MANHILVINACVRDDSRTAELSRHLLQYMAGEITTVDLYNENLSPLDGTGLEKRAQQAYSEEELKLAKQFQAAETIVIAAPFWDLSFPSVLKVYLENIMISGITFSYTDSGRPTGHCCAKKLYYITTAGGYIGKNNYGFDYIKALAENFFGIREVVFYAAEGLDIFGADVNAIMTETKNHMDKEEGHE